MLTFFVSLPDLISQSVSSSLTSILIVFSKGKNIYWCTCTLDICVALKCNCGVSKISIYI